MWFSILVRKLLRRASFTSQTQLKERILEFIDYFNRTMAKPFKWTYQGKALKG
jgi:putative transposase